MIDSVRAWQVPTVSVCIPTYNGATYLQEAIASVLAQTYTSLEVVVGDHDSTDTTLDVARSFSDQRVVVLPSHGRCAPAENWNRCVDAAKGKYVKVMGQDDVLLPEAVGIQVQLLAKHPTAVLCVGRRNIISWSGRTIFTPAGLGRRLGLFDQTELVRACLKAGSNAIGEPVVGLFRADAAREAGGFDLQRRYVIDLDFWLRLAGTGRVVHTPEVVAGFRVHGDSWGRSMHSSQFAETMAFLDQIAVNQGLSVSGWRRARIRTRAALRAAVYGVMRVSETASRRSSGDVAE